MKTLLQSQHLYATLGVDFPCDAARRRTTQGKRCWRRRGGKPRFLCDVSILLFVKVFHVMQREDEEAQQKLQKEKHRRSWMKHEEMFGYHLMFLRDVLAQTSMAYQCVWCVFGTRLPRHSWRHFMAYQCVCAHHSMQVKKHTCSDSDDIPVCMRQFFHAAWCCMHSCIWHCFLV